MVCCCFHRSLSSFVWAYLSLSMRWSLLFSWMFQAGDAYFGQSACHGIVLCITLFIYEACLLISWNYLVLFSSHLQSWGFPRVHSYLPVVQIIAVPFGVPSGVSWHHLLWSILKLNWLLCSTLSWDLLKLEVAEPFQDNVCSSWPIFCLLNVVLCP